MKKLLMAATAASALAASPALAATTADYAVTGNVAAVCSVTAAGTVDFGALTGTNGAYSNSGISTEVTDSAAYCNQAATTVTISHTNLTTTTTGTLPATFTKTVVITPVVTADSGAFGDVTGGTIGAFSSLKVKATATAPTLKLIAGAYTGSITITLSPAS